MAKRLSDDEKYWRGLPAGQLADRVGHLKAEIAALGDLVAQARDEAVRRGLTEADGELFRITLSPPGARTQLDRAALELEHPNIVRRYLVEVPTDWVLRCVARRQALTRKAAA